MKTSRSDVMEKGKANLTGERVLKSILCGLGAGLSVGFVVGFITWFFEFKGFWLTIGLAVGVCAVASVLFYFFLFRPSTRNVMERIDRAGLDERMITMYELKDDDSYIAARQREDAQATFQTAMVASGGKLIKTKIPALILALAFAPSVVAIPAVVVTALSDYGVIPTGIALLRGDEDGPLGTKRYVISYVVGEDGGGMIEGELTQTVKAGESTTAVKAVPVKRDEKGNWYYFVGWMAEDGNIYRNTPSHSVSNVQSSQEFTAVFEVGDPIVDPGFSYYYDPNQDWESDNDSPDDSDNPSESHESESPKPGDNMGMPGPPSASATDPANTIIDGETPYEELYDYYHQIAMDMLVNGTDNYPPELVELLEGYFGIL